MTKKTTSPKYQELIGKKATLGESIVTIKVECPNHVLYVQGKDGLGRLAARRQLTLPDDSPQMEMNFQQKVNLTKIRYNEAKNNVVN